MNVLVQKDIVLSTYVGREICIYRHINIDHNLLKTYALQ